MAVHGIHARQVRPLDSGLIGKIEMNIVERARIFATAAHAAIGQLRKHTGDPYHIHPMNVVTILKGEGITDSAILAAAWLHDVVEDTKVTFARISVEFGSHIAELVREVTDVSSPGDVNRAVRKAMDFKHLANSSYGGATIKLADIIDNAPSITEHDPQFARIWLAEKAGMLDVLRQGHTGLWKEAKEIIDECLIKVNSA